MTVLLLCFALVSLFIVFRFRRRHMYKFASKFPPCYNELPLIGTVHKLITGNTEEIMNQLKIFSYAAIENDGIVRMWVFHILYFIAVDPVEVEKLLKVCLEKDDLHKLMRPVIGDGGIFAPCSIWRRRRKIIVPAFTPKIVESFVEVFAEQSEILAGLLAQRAGTGTDKFRAWPYVSTYTLDSVCRKNVLIIGSILPTATAVETVMGVRVNAQHNPKSPFLESLNTVLNLVTSRIFNMWLQPHWLFRQFPQYAEQKGCIKQMHGFTDEVIRRKREEIKTEPHNKPEMDSAVYNSSNNRIKTFLDHLVHFSGKENGYTDIELREEVLTLTIAGTDTSAVAIGYTLKMLAKYPHVQKRAYEEINGVFGDSDRQLVAKDLQQLKYLERVVKETLRLFPPVPFIIRKVEKNVTLPSGRVLPAGSGVVISIWGIHRDPAHWGPDAEKFDPDRFLPERLNLKHVCSFMPFSQGPRNCVGYQYALMSIKTALTAVLRKCIVLPDPERSDIPYIRVKLDIMMKDVDEYQIGLQLRKPHANNYVPVA